jgi:hypothetical protein
MTNTMNIATEYTTALPASTARGGGVSLVPNKRVVSIPPGDMSTIATKETTAECTLRSKTKEEAAALPDNNAIKILYFIGLFCLTSRRYPITSVRIALS